MMELCTGVERAAGCEEGEGTNENQVSPFCKLTQIMQSKTMKVANINMNEVDSRTLLFPKPNCAMTGLTGKFQDDEC